MSTDPRWTAETVELLASADYEAGAIVGGGIPWPNQDDDTRDRYRRRARIGLTALADAGLLVPMGGETRREGICGAEHTKLFVNCAKTFPVICVLSHGHDSAWHEGDTGERWRPRSIRETRTENLDVAARRDTRRRGRATPVDRLMATGSPECMTNLCESCDNDLGCECECHTNGTSGPQGDEPAAPRVWAMPTVPIIPQDVQAVRDKDGFVWRREGDDVRLDVWRRSTGAWIAGDRLIASVGPLTEVVDGSTDRAGEPWHCRSCGSGRWVAASLTGPVGYGGRAIKQCVPCGRYSSDSLTEVDGSQT
jgi:hypothetical protein